MESLWLLLLLTELLEARSPHATVLGNKEKQSSPYSTYLHIAFTILTCLHRAQQWLHTKPYLLQSRAGQKCNGWRRLSHPPQIALSPSTPVSPHPPPSFPPSSPAYSPLSSYPAPLNPSILPLPHLYPFSSVVFLSSCWFFPPAHPLHPAIFPVCYISLPLSSHLLPFLVILTPTLPVFLHSHHCSTLFFSHSSLIPPAAFSPPFLFLLTSSLFCSSYFPAILHSI